MADDDLRVNRSLRIPRWEIIESFSTSGGPGGQHANKVATRVDVTFDAANSPSLDRRQRARIVRRHGPLVQLSVDDTRSQARNRQLATERLAERLAAALEVPKKRRPTRPTRGSQRRRLQAKRRRSEIKANRRKPGLDD